MEKNTKKLMGIETYTKPFDKKKMAIKEFEILSWAYENGLYVPKVISDSVHKVISPTDGKPHWGFSMQLIKPEIELTDDNLKKLLETCVELHSLKVPGHIKNILRKYSDEGKVYAEILGLNGDFKYHLKHMDSISRCLVHNDLVKVNLAGNGKIAPLDFGEAIYGIPQTDVVRALYTFKKLDNSEEKNIIDFYKQLYLKSNPDKKEKFDIELGLAKSYQFVKFAAGCLNLSKKDGIGNEEKASLEESMKDFLARGGYKR